MAYMIGWVTKRKRDLRTVMRINRIHELRAVHLSRTH